MTNALSGLTFFLILLCPGSLTAQDVHSVENLQSSWAERHAVLDQQGLGAWWKSLDAEQLSRYLAAGVDVNASNKRGWTALHSAARYSTDVEIVLALLESGALVDAQDKSGDTALHWAAGANSNPEIVGCLLDSGASVDTRDKFGWSPLHTAASTSSASEVIRLLVDAGANRGQRAYFILFSPSFLLKHNENMSASDKRAALAYLSWPEDCKTG